MKLFAGAGKAIIEYTPEVFPTKPEKYTGVHDNPCVRVLLLKTGDSSFALANFELVSLNFDIVPFKQIISGITGIDAQRIWVCVTHSLPTPHLFPPDENYSDEEVARWKRQHQIVENALIKAVDAAVDSMQEALFGYDRTYSYINVNRAIDTNKGWWLGSNENAPSNKEVEVFKFDGVSGNTIAILYNYNSQCSILDDVYTLSGDRLVSADLSGTSTKFVEDEFETVAMYCLGAGGDQAPIFKGFRTVRGKNGNTKSVDIHESAYLLNELIGERIGETVVACAEKIECKELMVPIKITSRTIKCKGQLIMPTKEIVPRKEYEYVECGELEAPVELLQIGDAAIIGIQPEIGIRTASKIKDNSPFAITGLMTFVNGGAKYMPEEDMYEKITFQSINSRFVKGTAEYFSDEIIEFVNCEQKSYRICFSEE